MIVLTDIKTSITNVLKTIGYKVYGNEVVEGFSRPSFFSQLIPISSDIFKKYTSENVLMVEIVYYSLGRTDLENLKMYDILKKSFGSNLQIGIRKILIRKFRSEVIDEVDNIYSIKFDLNFYDEIEDDTPVVDTMQELSLNLRRS